MSVLIKGMEMPKPGAYMCELGVLDENTAVLTLYTPIDDPQRSYKLIPVPPHGDLIDRYDLKNKNIIIDYDEWDDTFEDGLLFVADLIDNAPIIIEAEEKL